MSLLTVPYLMEHLFQWIILKKILSISGSQARSMKWQILSHVSTCEWTDCSQTVNLFVILQRINEFSGHFYAKQLTSWRTCHVGSYWRSSWTASGGPFLQAVWSGISPYSRMRRWNKLFQRSTNMWILYPIWISLHLGLRIKSSLPVVLSVILVGTSTKLAYIPKNSHTRYVEEISEDNVNGDINQYWRGQMKR